MSGLCVGSPCWRLAGYDLKLVPKVGHGRTLEDFLIEQRSGRDWPMMLDPYTLAERRVAKLYRERDEYVK